MALSLNPLAVFRRPAGYISAEWGRMGPRERRLVSAVGSAAVVIVVVGVVFFVMQSLSEIRESNAAARDALSAIARHRSDFLEAKSKLAAQEYRIGTEPPQLAADLEAAAREVGVQIPETSPRPQVPAGKRYVEHAVDVTLRQVDLYVLSRFLQKLETGRRLIVVTKLQIRRRFADDKLDVSLTAAGFEKVKEGAAKRKLTNAPGKEKT